MKEVILLDKFIIEAKGGNHNRAQARVKCKDQSQIAVIKYQGEEYTGYVADLNNDYIGLVLANDIRLDKLAPLTKLEARITLYDTQYSISGPLLLPPRKMEDNRTIFVIRYAKNTAEEVLEKLHRFIHVCKLTLVV